MTKKPILKARPTHFPPKLWHAIDKDARRHKRSSVKQMEWILCIYYGFLDAENNYKDMQKRINTVRHAAQESS